MQEIDNSSIEGSGDLHLHDDHDLFMKEVIRDDHELLYLDTYLKEILRDTDNAE